MGEPWGYNPIPPIGPGCLGKETLQETENKGPNICLGWSGNWGRGHSERKEWAAPLATAKGHSLCPQGPQTFPNST